MPKVFVSYRIKDSVHTTSAIAERLARHYGRENVFRDRASLPLGGVYPDRIRRELERADVVIAVIGPSWLDITDGKGGRCLDNPDDWVRTELRMAFERRIPVVPVLLDGTPLPDRSRLPADIELVSLSMYWHVRHQTFDSDVRGLIDGLGVDEPQPRQGKEQGQNVQHNSASDGGTVVANQGSGNQTVNLPHGWSPR